MDEFDVVDKWFGTGPDPEPEDLGPEPWAAEPAAGEVEPALGYAPADPIEALAAEFTPEEMQALADLPPEELEQWAAENLTPEEMQYFANNQGAQYEDAVATVEEAQGRQYTLDVIGEKLTAAGATNWVPEEILEQADRLFTDAATQLRAQGFTDAQINVPEVAEALIDQAIEAQRVRVITDRALKLV